MARNGSGTYSLPAGNPVVSGTTISDVTHNATMSDIASEITNSLPRDGQAPPTANLPMGAFKHTNVANASAPTEYAAYGQVVPAAGGTYTGAVTFSNTTTFAGVATHTANIIIDNTAPAVLLKKADSGQSAWVESRTNNLTRWQWVLGDVTAEGGSNAGSNTTLNRYNDAGAFIATALTVYRDTGALSLEASGSLRTAGHISRYESPAETFTGSGGRSYTTRTPGCTRKPDHVSIILTNITAELGFATGDETTTSESLLGYHFDSSANTITVHQANIPQVMRPDVNSYATISFTNWSFRIVATWL